MQVIYLHQYFTTPDMAGGTRSYEMSRRLVKAGHTVHMITTDRSGRQRGCWKYERVEGIDVHWLPVSYSNGFGNRQRVRAFMEFAWRAAGKAMSIGGDVVFATSTPLTIALPAIVASRQLQVPFVFEVRDLWPEMPIAIGALRNPLGVAAARWLERTAYRSAAEIVALSPGMKQGVINTGVPGHRVSVIPNSCDSSLFNLDSGRGEAFRAKYNWLGSRPLVVYGGTLGMLNGVDYLAEIAAEVKQIDPDIRFLVVGEGREEENVRRVAAKLGVLDSNFFMLGTLPKCEMPECLSAATIATSLFIDLEPMWINSANKFFDALAARRPVMINYGGWQADLLGQRGAGLVVPPRDSLKAAESLVAFLRDPSRLRAARIAANDLAQNTFDRDRLAQELIGVLERAVETNS